jgi:hypothetical protein
VSLSQDMAREMLAYRRPLASRKTAAVLYEWLRQKIGVENALWLRMLPLGVARIAVDAGTLLWRPHPGFDLREGGRAIILPVHAEDGALVDLLALFPDDARHHWLRYGAAGLLGEASLARARHYRLPVVVHDSPLAMLRAYCRRWAAHDAEMQAGMAELAVLKAEAAARMDGAAAQATLPIVAAVAAAKQALIVEAAKLEAPDWEDAGCCLIGGGQDHEALFVGVAGIRVENPVFGTALVKAIKAARNRRRAQEPGLPAVLMLDDETAEDDGAAAQDEALAATDADAPPPQPALAEAGEDAGEDELYGRAVALVLRAGKASTSFLQRQLQLGYNTAARLIERMEAEAIVSAADHLGKRAVIGHGDAGSDAGGESDAA